MVADGKRSRTTVMYSANLSWVITIRYEKELIRRGWITYTPYQKGNEAPIWQPEQYGNARAYYTLTQEGYAALGIFDHAVTLMWGAQ